LIIVVEIINGRESFAGQVEDSLIFPVLILLIVLVLVDRVCRIKAEPLSDKLFSHFEHD
jgi:hypothetical protein